MDADSIVDSKHVEYLGVVFFITAYMNLFNMYQFFSYLAMVNVFLKSCDVIASLYGISL